jgi:hypothetical protein
VSNNPLELAVLSRVDLGKSRQKMAQRNEDPHGQGDQKMRRFTLSALDTASIKRNYLNVFALLTSDRRTALIKYYEAKHGCGEIEAMNFAIIDRQNDEERYG